MYSKYLIDSQLNNILKNISNPTKLLSLESSPISEGSSTTNKFESTLNYLWDNYSDFFSVYRKYRYIRELEKEYKISSEDLLLKWMKGELKNRSYIMSEWISTYLKIREFLHYEER